MELLEALPAIFLLSANIMLLQIDNLFHLNLRTR